MRTARLLFVMAATFVIAAAVFRLVLPRNIGIDLAVHDTYFVVPLRTFLPLIFVSLAGLVSAIGAAKLAFAHRP